MEPQKVKVCGLSHPHHFLHPYQTLSGSVIYLMKVSEGTHLNALAGEIKLGTCAYHYNKTSA